MNEKSDAHMKNFLWKALQEHSEAICDCAIDCKHKSCETHYIHVCWAFLLQVIYFSTSNLILSNVLFTHSCIAQWKFLVRKVYFSSINVVSRGEVKNNKKIQFEYLCNV